MNQTWAKVEIIIGQNDGDALPEGQIVVSVGSAEVFRSPVLDAGDLGKLAGFAVSLATAFARRK